MNPRTRAQATAEAEAARQRAPITDRVNIEPAILNGMTVTEAQWIAGIAMVVFLLIGGLLYLVTGLWQFVLLLTVFGTALTLWFGSQVLARVKRGRPDAYYTQAIHLWLVQRGLAGAKFIHHQGWWSLGRSLGFSLESPRQPPQEKFPKP